MTSKRKSPSRASKAKAAPYAPASLASMRSIAKKTQASGDILRKVTQIKPVLKLSEKLVNKPPFIDFHPFDDSVDQWQLDTFFTADADTADAPLTTLSKAAMADFSKKVTEAAKIKPLKQGKKPSSPALVKMPEGFGVAKPQIQQQKPAKTLNAGASDCAEIKSTAPKPLSGRSSKLTSNNQQTPKDTQVTAKSIFSVLNAMANAAGAIAGVDSGMPTPSTKPNNSKPSFAKVDAKPATLAQAVAGAASGAQGAKDSSAGSEFKTETNSSQPSFSALTGLTELVSQLWQLPSNSGNKASAPAMSTSTKPFDHRDDYRNNPGIAVDTNDPFSRKDHFLNTALEYNSRAKEQEAEHSSSAIATGPAPTTSPSDLAEAINGVLKEQAWLRGTQIP